MSRSRNLKPGFFRNEELASLNPLTRIFFQGLWCEADRRGIVEDRPKRLKADILPYDKANPDTMLENLESKGFIQRYEADGARCIFIVKFALHQNPHKDEKVNTLPAPCQHSVDTVPTPVETGSNREDSLNTDSSPLIPDSLETPPVVPQEPSDPSPEEPKPIPPKPIEPKPRTERQQQSDALFERRRLIFEAYCRGLGIDTESLPATQRKSRSFNSLTVPILDTPECEPGIVESLTRYTRSAYRWRNGKQTPDLQEVLAAFPEWDEAGRPDEATKPSRASPSGPSTSRSSQIADAFDELSRERGEAPNEPENIIDVTNYRIGA